MLATAALAMLAATACATERVALSNGFSMQCDHHALVEGHVRLYLSAGENNYIELSPDEISRFEDVPDQAPDQTAPGRTQGAEAAPHAQRDAMLSAADLREVLNRAGQEHNLDVDLLGSVVKAESDGNAHAESRAGARGLMQLMPHTAAKLGVEDSFNPKENVQGGSAYLDGMLRRFHENLALALAAYNAGPEAVDRYHGIPPFAETRAYVARVIHEFNRRVLAREARTRRAATAARLGSASR